MKRLLTALSLFAVGVVHANPYFDPAKVPQDSSYAFAKRLQVSARALSLLPLRTRASGSEVLRVQVDFDTQKESYSIAQTMLELSGTPALSARAPHRPHWGSYLGVLKFDGKTYYDSVGTGKEYRLLTRAMSFRFPPPSASAQFEMWAENPKTGAMEKVVAETLMRKQFETLPALKGVEVRELQKATREPSLQVAIYAEGYHAGRERTFFADAMKAVTALQEAKLPGVEQMQFVGVFYPSEKGLDEQFSRGMPVPEYESWLGMYHPYWDDFGRWRDVIYPSREGKLRAGLAAVAYDYPILLVDSYDYWGVGNYMAFTAIPARRYDFVYLLLHEIGHFFGLNEEYKGGGRTELEFAAGLREPWSQNMTYLLTTKWEDLKWNKFVDRATPIPTPGDSWRRTPGLFGAYEGGYADSVGDYGPNYKPGMACVMERDKNFCQVCAAGIRAVVDHSTGVME